MHDKFTIRCRQCGCENRFIAAEPSEAVQEHDGGTGADPGKHPKGNGRSSRKGSVPKPSVGPVPALSQISGAEILAEVRHDVQEAWLKLYPQKFLEVEITKASNWLKNNPTRQKKLVGRFLATWLDKASLNRAFGEHKRPTTGLNLIAEVDES